MTDDLNQQAMDDYAQEAEQNAECDDHEEDYVGFKNRFLIMLTMPSWLVSLVVHIVLLVVLGIFTFGPELDQVVHVLTIGMEEKPEEIEDIEPPEIVTPISPDTPIDDAVDAQQVVQPQEVDPTESLIPANDPDMAAAHVQLTDTFTDRTADRADLNRDFGAATGTGVSGRGAKMRSKLVTLYDGNTEGEQAVALALAWLAEHQLPDGGWSFDHRNGRCQGRCTQQGNLSDARNGATGLALLPFLGAGHTHQEGKYKDVVRAGLYFLMNKMKPDGSLHEAGGTMYSHGICAIALCEAYAMTNDRDLMAPAQASLNFIVAAQDPVGGGWRYQPREAGDTSAVGWQLMALKSGHMAYLNVPPQTLRNATKFLDSVQQDSGATYGYTTPGAGSATTAVGLLSRMYLGWEKENPALERGIEFLSKRGPSKNMYFNYYATQVLKQYEGESWKKWNAVMRDQMINSQDKTGHRKGSWYFEGGDHGASRGGRLYTTCMATMVLEVYYRHMPIYQQRASEEDFPL